MDDVCFITERGAEETRNPDVCQWGNAVFSTRIWRDARENEKEIRRVLRMGFSRTNLVAGSVNAIL